MAYVNEIIEYLKNDEFMEELKNSNEELAEFFKNGEFMEFFKNSNEELAEYLKNDEDIKILKNLFDEKMKMGMNIISKCLNTSKGNIPSFNENEKMFLKKEFEEDANDDDKMREIKNFNRYIWGKIGIYE